MSEQRKQFKDLGILKGIKTHDVPFLLLQIPSTHVWIGCVKREILPWNILCTTLVVWLYSMLTWGLQQYQ